MGETSYRAVLVTSHDSASIRLAQKAAKDQLSAADAIELVSPLLGGLTNNCLTFVISPDGSKAGWATSQKVNEAVHAFLGWLEDHRYELHLTWVEVVYGDYREDSSDTHAGDARVTDSTGMAFHRVDVKAGEF